jgi:hypothetical protein
VQLKNFMLWIEKCGALLESGDVPAKSRSHK